jgi:cobalt/nickel transport system permease protein
MNLPRESRLGRLDSPIHRLDARAKLLAFVVLLLAAVSTEPELLGAFAGYGALLLAVTAAARIPLRALAARVLPLLAFVAAASALIPFLHRDPAPAGAVLEAGAIQVSRAGLLLFAGVLGKATVGIVGAVFLSATTTFPELLRALERLRAPRVLVALTGFTYRYLFVLADEAQRMLRARDARCYGGRWLWQAGVLGHMIGTLFLRAHERAERVYAAMVARGFTGDHAGPEKAPLRRADYAFVAAAVAAAILVRAGLP